MKEATVRESFRLYAADRLVGMNEIADRLDVRLGTVHRWRERYLDFPAPVTTLKIGPVWVWADVEEWAAMTGRLREENSP